MKYEKIKRNEILDKILTLLMSFDATGFKMILDVISPPKIDIKFISEALSEYEWEDYMKESFEKELLYKNYITKDNEGNLSITEFGREFKRKGGYAAIDKKEKQEDTIREKTIESFRYDKLALIVSIAAIIISIIGLMLK
jgi:hypothetical protein